MQLKDFDYRLPPSLIAQTPLERRDSSRLLVLGRGDGAITHSVFHRLPEYLRAGDCLIVNDTRVMPARLYGRKETGAQAEVVLLKRLKDDEWECIVRPGKRLRSGARVVFSEKLSGEIIGELNGGNRVIRFFYGGTDFFSVLERVGLMPLPPYITEKLEDGERYQTVYAKEKGSAAAPTAGLHFTPELLDTLRAKGVGIGHITLHVGLGTFRPVKTQHITDHRMHSEAYTLPGETAALVRRTKENGGRVIAVGTTVCRTLESVAREYGQITAASGQTALFLYPGCGFRVIDGLITNFHLPQSTLLMLVCAFAGYENAIRAYRTAVEQKYRFFSFGDAMMIL